MRLLPLCVAAGALSLAPAADTIRVNFDTVKPEVIQQRLDSVKRDLRARRETLESLFREAGCATSTQRVPGSKEPNVICELPAATGDAQTIIVGGHYDFAEIGTGVVDDWTGVSLLPSLYQSLAREPRHHRFVFVAFAAEEKGLVGSREYVKKLSKPERAVIRAMVNLECLGLAPPTVWATRSDKQLTGAYIRVAQTLGLTPSGTNIDRVGDDDSHPFLNAKIPVVSIHSLTNEKWRILHSVDDNLHAVDATHYYDAYRLTALYLAYIDARFD